MNRQYVIVTPVRDEEDFLELTIASVVGQRERPVTWVLVDDGSTDRTPLILVAAAEQHPWIRVVSMPPRTRRILGAGVVQAFNAGLSTIDLTGIDFISKLDADLELHPSYFATLMDRMEQDPRLGIASGEAWVRHADGTESYERGAPEMSIGQAKFYRRSVLEEIGGLAEKLAWDGIDSHEARIRGWRSRRFPDPELRVMTLRPEGASDRSVLRGRRRRGRGQWILGSDPLFMASSALLRIRDEPAVLGSLHTLYGYAAAALTGVQRHGTPAYGTQVRRFQREAMLLGKRRATERFEQRTASRWSAPARRAALLVSQHPTLSHTFIDREIRGLRDQGWEISPFSLRRGEAVHEGSQAVTVLRSLPLRRTAGHLARALAHPWAMLSTTSEALRPRGGSFRPVGLAYLGQAVLLLGEMRRQDLRHVHVHFANNGAEVARLATYLSERDTVGTPISYSLTIHGLSMHGAAASEEDCFPERNARRWGPLETKVRTARSVRCVDHGSARRVRELTGRDDIRVVHVGIDPDRFRGVVRREGSEFVVGFVGRLAPEKQVPLLLEAFARMTVSPRRLRLAGSGPCEEECRTLAAVLAPGRDVSFVGPVAQQELPDFLAGVDALALSSNYEGTPIVLMEAMAAGLPVVAPAVGGIPDLVEHEVSGLLVPPGDPLALARALDRLAQDPGLRAELGRAGARTVEARFNSAHVAREMSEFLQEATAPAARALPQSAPASPGAPG